MKKTICTLLLTFISVCIAYAQTTITGVVRDASGESLPGASVMIKGTTRGTLTDTNGSFSIKVQNPAIDVLKISFVGMKEKMIPLKGKISGIVVMLDPDSKQLDEMVVIGYGTMMKKDLTGAVSSLSSDVIKDLPVSSTLEAITGRMSGVNVQTTEGSPDAEITIRVRGGGSITQDNTPLFIVDGFRVPSIANIAPRDIQSIDVLKDASSTAIYGSEGANGVVIITTKSGQKGRVTVSLNTFFGVKKAYNLPRAMSPYEYVYYQKELDPTPTAGFFGMYGLWEDVDIYKSMKGDDWVNRLFNNPTTQQNYNLSVSGGTDNVKFNLSMTHDDQGFIMKNSNFTRDNIVFKVNANISKTLKFDFTNRLANTVIDGPNVSNGKLLVSCVRFPSVKSLTQLSDSQLNGADDDLSLESIGSLTNPIANIVNDYKKQNQFENTYNAGLSWDIFKDLTFRSQASYTFKRNYTDEIWTKNTGQAIYNGGMPVAQRIDITGDRLNIQNTLTYKHEFSKKNKMDLLFGQEENSTQDKQIFFQSKFYPYEMTAQEILAMWNYGQPLPTYTTIGEPVKTYSYFGRFNYQLKERYLLTLTAREDGKNVFAPGRRWGFFPGAAVAWRISEEDFLKGKTPVSNLKLRLSYGEVGNARVGSYWRQDWSFVTSSSSLNYPNEVAASAMQTSKVMYNDKLQWESKISRNIGIDFGVFKDKLNGSVDIYKESTKNLILQMPLPLSSGYSSQYQNVGQTSNQGVEVSLNYNLVDKKDFSVTANFNIAFNRNRIDKYIVNNQTLSSGAPYSISSADYVVNEGQPVGQMYGYVSDGVYTFDDFYWNKKEGKWNLYNGITSDQALLSTSGNYFGPGHMKLKDLDGDGIITEADKTIIGSAQPLHTGGFGLTMKWKGFDLSSLFNWSYGNDVYNVNKVIFNTYSGSKRYNNLTDQFSLDKRFTTIDPTTGYNIMYGTYANPDLLKTLNQNSTLWSPLINSTIPVSWAVEDGSFLRLSSLTLGYTVPMQISKKLMIQNFRLYANLYNVFCLTKYSGQDPEVSTSSGNTLTPGVDYSAYPKSKSFVLGVNITF